MAEHAIAEWVSTRGQVIVACRCGWTHAESSVTSAAVARELCRLAMRVHKSQARTDALLRDDIAGRRMLAAKLDRGGPKARERARTLREQIDRLEAALSTRRVLR